MSDVKRHSLTKEEFVRCYELHQRKLSEEMFLNRYVREIICDRLSIKFEENDINLDFKTGELSVKPKPKVEPIIPEEMGAKVAEEIENARQARQ